MAKAATKGLKIKRKRGRPRKEGVMREPNGRESRAKDPPQRLALEARARMLGISVIEANDPDCATFIGALHAAHMRWVRQCEAYAAHRTSTPPPENPPAQSISTRQYDAILKFLDLRNNALKVFNAEGAEYDNRPAWSTAPIFTDDEVARKAEATKQRYTASRAAIQKHQNVNRTENLWAAVDICLIRGERMPHLTGAIRHVGNALAEFFKA